MNRHNLFTITTQEVVAVNFFTSSDFYKTWLILSPDLNRILVQRHDILIESVFKELPVN